MSRQYRAWRDFLIREVEDNMPSDQSYYLLHTASMVGLFSCVFVKESLRSNVNDLQIAEVKRGLGGFHGNKVGLLETQLICSTAKFRIRELFCFGSYCTTVLSVLSTVIWPPVRHRQSREIVISLRFSKRTLSHSNGTHRNASTASSVVETAA
jgi:hypothetical protein